MGRGDEMGFLNKLDKHSGLIGSMAETVQVDLSEALATGRISGQELRNAVVSCMGCEGVSDCEGWLAAHAEGAEVTPAYCRNGALMDRLRIG